MGAPLRLTPTMCSRKLQALGFIRAYLARHAVSPSLSEIGAGVGASRQRAHWYVKQLEADGHILRTPGEPRSIRLAAPVATGAGRALTDMGLPMLPALLHTSAPDVPE